MYKKQTKKEKKTTTKFPANGASYIPVKRRHLRYSIFVTALQGNNIRITR